MDAETWPCWMCTKEITGETLRTLELKGGASMLLVAVCTDCYLDVYKMAVDRRMQVIAAQQLAEA